MTEDQLQMSIVDYVRKCIPKAMIFCSLNGVWLGNGNKSFIYMQKLKKIGLTVGEPDLRIHWPPSKTLFLELKIKPNKPTEHQANCMADLTNIGFPCEVVYSLDEAIEIMKRYDLPINHK